MLFRSEIGDGCQHILIIRVHTDEGITGIGEAHSNPVVSKAVLDSPMCSVSASGIKRLLIGEDPRDINRLYDKLYKKSVTYGRRGAVMHVISGIEIALWDILGKSVGQPIHRLLGGARKFEFDGTCLDDDVTFVTVLAHLVGEVGSGQARRNLRDVAEEGPDRVERLGDFEGVGDQHETSCERNEAGSFLNEYLQPGQQK